jgi:glycosyltransferase involved in cell wall biosynthesis
MIIRQRQKAPSRMNPVVSIIIPTYNSGNTLELCLQSIVRQTYFYKEVVVIDGGSTDRTQQILQQYGERYPFIAYVSEKDSGVYDAMNKGIDKSKGDYLFFMGSDDEFYSDTVLADVFSDESNSGVDFLYGNVFFKHVQQVYSGRSSLEKLVGEQTSICHQAIFYKKNVFDRVGKYDLKYFVHADYDLNVKCFEHPDIKTKYLDKIITLYNEQGMSGQQSNKDGFHDWLTLHYISKYASPFDLILKIKKQKEELQRIKNSKAYKLSVALSKTVARLKGVRASILRSSR